MTVKIQSETGVEIAKYNNAQFRHNEETATAVIWNDHGQVELSWVERDKENKSVWHGELQPSGDFVKVVVAA